MEPMYVREPASKSELIEVRYVDRKHNVTCSDQNKIAIKANQSGSKLVRCCYGFDDLEIVKCIDVPRGWVKDTGDTGRVPGRVVCRYMPRKDPAVWLELSIEAMSRRPNGESARLFRETLAEQPHVLSLDEIKGLRWVLGRRTDSNDFEMRDCRTVDWNGKRALLAEGHWLKDDMDDYSLFVDIRGDGLAPLNIFFYAPPVQYRRLGPLAKAAIKSVEWKLREGI